MINDWPEKVNVPQNTIKKIVSEASIGSEILSIGEPNAWVMQSYKIVLANEKTLLLQISIVDEWTDAASIISRVNAVTMLQKAGIPQPSVISYAENKDKYGFRFILSEAHTGGQLFRLYPCANAEARLEMFGAIAKGYDRIHSVKNGWAGVWDGTPDKSKYHINPAKFYLESNLKSGCNKNLLSKGLISGQTYEQIVKIWEDNLDYLMGREAALVNLDSFPWNIHLMMNNDVYSMGGLNSMGDVIWWDPMYDVSNLLYPPFMDISNAERNAFRQSYHQPIDEKAVCLYRLLNRVLAFDDCFMAPVDRRYGEKWIRDHLGELDELIHILAD